MQSNIKYTVSTYTGNKIGRGGFCARVGVQIVAHDQDTGRRRYVFSAGKSPCYKIYCGAAHYKGASAAVRDNLNAAGEKLRALAADLNAGRIEPGIL